MKCPKCGEELPKSKEELRLQLNNCLTIFQSWLNIPHSGEEELKKLAAKILDLHKQISS